MLLSLIPIQTKSKNYKTSKHSLNSNKKYRSTKNLSKYWKNHLNSDKTYCVIVVFACVFTTDCLSNMTMSMDLVKKKKSSSSEKSLINTKTIVHNFCMLLMSLIS